MAKKSVSLIDDLPLPRISLVTPSFNQAEFIEQTIRSVLMQGYPNLEYIIMDGGSTDGSVDIIRKYDTQITYWESRPDGGQSSAIQSGFEKSSGEILGYLNSDDILLPGSLDAIGHFFSSHKSAGMIVGKSLIIDNHNQTLRQIWGLLPTFRSLLFWGTGGFNQPASFWSKEAFHDVGGLDVSLKFAFDYDFYTRLAHNKCQILRLNAYLAAFRNHPASKTNTIQDIRKQEDALIQQRYGINRYSTLFRKLAYLCYEGRYRSFASWCRLRRVVGLEHSPDFSYYG